MDEKFEFLWKQLELASELNRPDISELTDIVKAGVALINAQAEWQKLEVWQDR